MKKEKTDNKKGIVTVEETTAAVKTTALTIIPKTESLEEQKKKLEEEIQQLRTRLAREPQTLEQKIEYFKVKQEKIKQLAKLEENSEQLFEHIEKLDNLTTEDDFKCDKYSLVVNSIGGYKESAVFTMNNPIIIRDVIKYVLQRINDKIDVLKMEIAE